MIAFLKGILFSVSVDSVVIDVQGVGYLVQVPSSVLPALPALGSEILLYTYLVMREDTVSLYGFNTAEYLDFFKMLLNVNGIGPKGALGLLSVMTPGGLAMAVSDDNAGLLAKAPGIGKKTAQRIILELKGKFKVQDYGVESMQSGNSSGANSDALEALISLGFDGSQAAVAVGDAIRHLGPEAPVAEVVRYALKQMAEIV